MEGRELRQKVLGVSGPGAWTTVGVLESQQRREGDVVSYCLQICSER